MGGMGLAATLDVMLRIVVAAACGLVIGIERKNRLKEAGTRTHLIVALGSALMTVVSKYGFFDLASYDFIKLDPSRTVAQIVSGIGFVGAGMIFLRHQTVTGLTTAAGVWATAGIGMAVGCGLYAVGIFSTLLVLLVQLLLHAEPRWMKLPGCLAVDLRVRESPETLARILEKLAAMNVRVVNLEVTRKSDGIAKLELFLRIPASFSSAEMVAALGGLEDVLHIDA